MRVSRLFAADAMVLVILLLLFGGAAGAASQPPVLLVVGDSLSAAYKIPVKAGWVHLLSERLKRKGYDYRVVNASISGDTTAGGLARLPGELKRSQPAIVIIELGGNDGLQGLPLKQMQHNLAHMVTLAQDAGAKVLLVGVRMPPNYGPAFTQRFEAVYRKVAHAKNVPLIPELMKGVVSHPDLMQERGIHPRAAAEPKLLDNVWPALQPLLEKQSQVGISRKAAYRHLASARNTALTNPNAGKASLSGSVPGRMQGARVQQGSFPFKPAQRGSRPGTGPPEGSHYDARLQCCVRLP